MAVTIWSSVQVPMPVWRSGVMFVEYTVPNGPSYLRPPAFSGAPFLGSVWQPQPAAAPNTYFPRATRSALTGLWAPAELGVPAGLWGPGGPGGPGGLCAPMGPERIRTSAVAAVAASRPRPRVSRIEGWHAASIPGSTRGRERWFPSALTLLGRSRRGTLDRLEGDLHHEGILARVVVMPAAS